MTAKENYSMDEISPLIKQIDLPSLAEREGIQLKASGRQLVGLCPFHAEKTPSFFVFSDNHYKCFSCHEHGDPVDLVRRLHGFTFRDALAYLGMETRPASAEQFWEIKKRIKEGEARRERREARQKRESDLAYTLGTMLRRIAGASLALTPDNLYMLGGILSDIPWLEWGHDTLIHGNPRDKAYVLWSFKGYPVIERGQLFREDFDFGRWLRDFAIPTNRSADEFNIELQFE